MVSFCCARCNDVIKKPKVVSHAAQCGTNSYSCVDCMQVFDMNSIQKHNSCMSEVQKYQGKWVPNFKKDVKDDSDSDSEETKRKAHTMQRTSRPKLSFSDSDDSDEEKKETKKAAAPAPAAKKAVVPAHKRARDSDDSDSDEEDKKKAAKAKPRTASPATKPAAAPTAAALKKKAAASSSPSNSPARKPVTAASVKLEKLTLPASNVASAPTTEYFFNKEGTAIPLGNHELIAEIVDEIIAEHNGKATASTVSQELVLRYQKRLGKIMAVAIAPILKAKGL